MGQRTVIQLTDGATTPVVHSFSPSEIKDNLMYWRDRSQAIYVGQNRLRLSQRVPGKDARTTKVVWNLTMPTLAVTAPTTGSGIQPAPSVAYENLAELSFVTHERSTLQERKDLLAMLRDLIDEGIVATQVHDGELIY